VIEKGKPEGANRPIRNASYRTPLLTRGFHPEGLLIRPSGSGIMSYTQSTFV
jgi:hypothetical protein